VSTGFDESKVTILKNKVQVKTKVQIKKFKDVELQALLDENSIQTLEELAEEH